MWRAKLLIQNIFECVPVHKNISLKIDSTHSSECGCQFQKARPFLYLLRIIYQMWFFRFLLFWSIHLTVTVRQIFYQHKYCMAMWSNPCPKLKSYKTEFLIRLILSINLDPNRWFFWHYLIFNVDHFSVKRFDPNV